MILEIALFIIGIALLVYCSDSVVASSIKLAERLRISEFVIGLLVVALGTSIPELAASILASAKGHSTIVLGNVLGSNIANIGLVLAVGGLAGASHITSNRMHNIQANIMLFVSLLLVFLGLTGSLGTTAAVLFLGLFGLYAWLVGGRAAYQAEHHRDPKTIIPKGEAALSAWVHLAVVGASTFGLWLGATWVVDGVLELSSLLGIGEGLVALTAVAIGTSLPELTVAIQSARKRHDDLLFGNVIGSNIINILLVLGVAALINPITVSPGLVVMLPVMAGFALALWMFMRTASRVTRGEAAMLLVAYIATIIVASWIG